MAYLTTYHAALPLTGQLDTSFLPSDATTTCRHMVDGSIFADFEHPICATAAMAGAAGIDIAILNDPHTG